MKKSKNLVWHSQNVTKKRRKKLLNQKSFVIWFTGLSGSGKSTIANALEDMLHKNGIKTYLLDGDNVRHGLNKNLGFTELDRAENIRRIGEVSKLFIDAGIIILAAFISPFKSDRQIVRSLVEYDEFVEVYVNTPLKECEKRDPKGLYKKARDGVIKNFTGIDSIYEVPENAEIEIKNSELSIEESSNRIMDFLVENGYIKSNNSDYII